MPPPRILKRNKNAKQIKHNLEKVEARAIPENKLKRTLELLNDHTNSGWPNEVRYCSQPIHQVEEFEQRQSVPEAYKIQLAQKFLLRRDWRSLAKLLTLSNPTGTRTNACFYSLYVKYATICLAHNNKEQLDVYIKSLIPTANSKSVIRQCTRYQPPEEENMEKFEKNDNSD